MVKERGVEPGAVDSSGNPVDERRPPRTRRAHSEPGPGNPMEDEQNRSKAGNPEVGENFRGEM